MEHNIVPPSGNLKSFLILNEEEESTESPTLEETTCPTASETSEFVEEFMPQKKKEPG